ncbi:hypothetical protein [Lysinibacillus parviboronicapiens]|uniref:hypothetical protein n=1 Tax=Lysinibacillus parviboronicapiens TaxID=436516 RepID=UPI000D341735|nr:hypothetical protein [Lysinibacillus parviboronicapiens]
MLKESFNNLSFMENEFFHETFSLFVGLTTNANCSEVTVNAIDDEGNVYKFYEPSSIFIYPAN